MAPGSFRFDRFELDPTDRRLTRDGAPVELNSRYLDALALLVREQGRLVSKERFLEAVWQGVPVTDEALTQCIRTLRRQLGDDAARPRFIETVPKHGYRFIAPVTDEIAHATAPTATMVTSPPGSTRLLTVGAGTLGGGFAGMLGGLFYGLAAVPQALPGGGFAPAVLVLICVGLVLGLIGGAGVSLGVAAAVALRGPGPWTLVGGAVGGLVVGAVVKLLGVAAFTVLFGRGPGEITGAGEGALLGAPVGFGVWMASRPASRPRAVSAAGLAGAAAGALIGLSGGRILGGSLDLLSRAFPQSHLQLGGLGAWLGESGFGPLALAVTAACEGLLFAACVVGAMGLVQRDRDAAG